MAAATTPRRTTEGREAALQLGMVSLCKSENRNMEGSASDGERRGVRNDVGVGVHRVL